MIKFFRNIRRQLMEKGSSAKYFKYAIGEILLVVIGILIAVSINNWNSERIDEHKELELLAQLRDDLNGALNDINNNMEVHEQSMISSKIILDHMDSKVPYHDSLGVHLSYAFMWTKLGLNRGTYETIKSHGLELIKNGDLRRSIVRMFESSAEFRNQMEQRLFTYSENLIQTRGANYFLEIFEGIGYVNGGFYPGNTVPLDYAQLRRDKEFRYHLKNFQNLTRAYQSISNQSYRRRIINTIEEIETEIQR